MEEALEKILINTYNPDNLLRHQAEQALNQFEGTPGSLSTLVNFIGGTHRHRELRQAASIIIKNKIRDYWVLDNPKHPVTADERVFIKTRIVDVLLAELDNSIRGLVAEAIKVIAEFDYPDK
jgi:hypothetical protein